MKHFYFEFDDLPEVPRNIHAEHGLQDDIQTLCDIHDDNVRNILNEMIPVTNFIFYKITQWYRRLFCKVNTHIGQFWHLTES